ncbi:Penicillinase repressor [Pirellulimonas nuda]|uniref:Penicillinase repressor n=1 Tax=Pirellulimonas nuda TaxID=2528009 RepID=A0A518D753_9BACT|nr:BlaI/MecI/CopY family transcriptional regulator [Pirellulimonas nuda]QDU87269.1 Penicillinase repressor [Pirellulimonas nuda]
MPRPPNPHPTDGELEILRVLWQGPQSLSAICEALRDEHASSRDRAPSTVATMLKVMAGKGLAARVGAGRGAMWRAKVSRRSATRGLVAKLVDGVFDGSASGLMAYLVETGGLDAKQLAELKKAVVAQTAPDGRGD